MGQSNFTPKHRKAAGRDFNSRKHVKALYDATWEKYRLKFLAVNPKCYTCGQPSQVVDHLVPHQGDKRLFEKTDNHIPLCKSHHDTITNLFDRRYRAGNPITPKLTWMKARRLSLGIMTRVKVLPTYP